jgi:hypothetical protein
MDIDSKSYNSDTVLPQEQFWNQPQPLNVQLVRETSSNDLSESAHEFVLIEQTSIGSVLCKSTNKPPLICHFVISSHQSRSSNLKTVLNPMLLQQLLQNRDKISICVLSPKEQPSTSSFKEVMSVSKSLAVHLGPDIKRQAIMAFSVLCSVVTHHSIDKTQANFYSNGISSANIPDLPCRDALPAEDFAVFWGAVKDFFQQSWFRRAWSIPEVFCHHGLACTNNHRFLHSMTLKTP